MQRFSSFPIPANSRGAALAIGNFDGVHLGHQSVLDQTQNAANGAPFGVLTFEPHPREYFAQMTGQTQAPFRLLNADARANRLEKLDLDILVEVPFDAALAALSPEEFCKNILCDSVGASMITVGADFKFGKGRAGNVETLKEMGQRMGFGVKVAELEQHGDIVISSTNIRQALADADPRRAAAMLGHWHRIEGPVIHGEKRGRELGFPTANMSIAGLHPPAFGVYAVVIDVLTGKHAGSYHGAASVGVRPMFGDNVPNCETYIFDFKGDLYGESLSVGLVDFLRGEQTFDSLDALIAQMDQDCQTARNLLAAL